MAILQIIFFLIFLLVPSFSHGLTVKDLPNPKVTANLFVQDSAKVLDTASFSAINQICKELSQKTGIEMAVVTVDNLDGLTVEDYAEQLFQKWGIGKKGQDNGVLILFALQDRKVRIEVGYGLEGVLTDAKSKKIIESNGIPNFKKKNYATGLYEMTFATAELLAKSSHIDLDLQKARSLPNENSEEKIGSLTIKEALFEKTYWKGFVGMIALALFFTPLLYFSIRSIPSLAGKKKYFTRISIIYVASSFLGGLALLIYLIYRLTEAGSSGWDVLGSLLAPIAGGFLGAVIFGRISKNIQKHIDHYHLKCSACGNRMNIVGESTDDKFLIPEEISEENAGGMDYEFWTCPQCSKQSSFKIKLGGATNCNQCQRRSLKITRRTLQSPTTSSSGLAIDTYQCYNKKCQFFAEKQVVLAKLPSSSSSGSSSGSGGGSSFGGGSSGGGGASGSW